MAQLKFSDAVREIVQSDPRYSEDAYFFVREALDFTVRLLGKPEAPGPKRHVTGGELLEGIRKFARQEYGQMALTVLKSWGLQRTEDVGEVVFRMVNMGLLGKTDEDKKKDFANGYDFYQAFTQPYLPSGGSRGIRPANSRNARAKKAEKDERPCR